MRKMFAASHHDLLSRSESWLEVDLGKQKPMSTPHRIEFDAHKRGLRLAHHLILQLARCRSATTVGLPFRWAAPTGRPTARSSGIASLQARTWGTRRHDVSGAAAWVALPDAVGPEDGIRRLRRGIRGPKVAVAFQADPELIGLPGFSGTRVLEVHQRATALAAHLKVGISHWPDSSTEPSGCTAGHVPSWMSVL